MKRLGLVGCSEQKLSVPAPASRLYNSQLFRMTMRYATATCDHVAVLSARYGFLELTDIIEPYHLSMEQLPKAQRVQWGIRVMTMLKHRYPDWSLVHFAGYDYTDQLPSGENPMRGLTVLRRYTWLHQQMKDWKK